MNCRLSGGGGGGGGGSVGMPGELPASRQRSSQGGVQEVYLELLSEVYFELLSGDAFLKDV